MSITFTITATNDITSFNEVDLSPSLNTTLTINSITDTERAGDTIANNSFRFEWYIVDKPTSSNASIVLTPNDTYKSSITFNSIDIWGSYRVFVVARNLNTDIYSEQNLFVAPESHFINLSVKSTNNDLEKPAATQRDWNTIYSNLTEVVDSSVKKINQIKVASDKTFVLPVVYGTGGQVLTTAGDGSLSWQDAAGGSSLVGLSSNDTDTLTLDTGFKLRFADGNAQIGELNGNRPSFVFANTIVANSAVLGVINDVTFDFNVQGTAGQALVTNGSDIVTFQDISYNNLVDIPTVTQNLGADTGSEILTFGGGRTLNIIGGNNVTTSVASDTNNISITINASSGGGGVVTGDKIEEGDTSVETIDSGSDGQIVFKTNNQSRWTFNNSGHLIPSDNEQYDIGSAENKVRHLYLSDNSLSIGDAKLSIGINDQMYSTSNNKSLDLDISSISLKNYTFNNSQVSPESIITGTTYRIENPGSIDFKIVGADSNTAGHIFEATADGTALTNDGIAYLNQSSRTPSNNYIYVQTNFDDSNKVDLKYNDGITGKNIVTVNDSGIQNNSVLSYNSGEWQSQSINDLSHKTWHATHSNEWTTSLAFVASGSKYASQIGALKYIFSFKNNTGNSLVIKKITLTCNEMYSSTIKWSASFATNAEFITNQSETLPAMSTSVSMSQQNKIGVQDGDLGIGFSEWNDDTYNQNNQTALQSDYFLLISINDMSSIHSSYSNKKFTATVYYA